MNSEIILPLLIYLVLIAALSVFAVRKKREGSFLTEYQSIGLCARPR